MNVLCTICAREGSKGLRKKNFLKLNGIELIWHTYHQAKKVKSISKIVISTDSKSFIKKAKSKNIDILFKRPKSLSVSTVGKVPVIRHALKKAENFYKQKFDIVMDLDVSSPLRNIQDIKNCLDIFKKKKSTNLITGTKARKNPYFNMIEISKNKVKLSKKHNKNIVRRQHAPIVYEMNASIYLWKRNYLLKNNKLFTKTTLFYEMPYERSVDIDSYIDFKVVKLLMKNEKKN